MNVGNLERTTQQDLMVSLYNFELITYRDKKSDSCSKQHHSTNRCYVGYSAVCHVDSIQAGYQPCQNMQAFDAAVVQNYCKMRT